MCLPPCGTLVHTSVCLCLWASRRRCSIGAAAEEEEEEGEGEEATTATSFPFYFSSVFFRIGVISKLLAWPVESRRAARETARWGAGGRRRSIICLFIVTDTLRERKKMKSFSFEFRESEA